MKEPDDAPVFTEGGLLRLFYLVVVIVSYIGAFAGLFGGFIILLWQSVRWLKVGVWHNLVVMDALRDLEISPPAVGWVGVQRLINPIVEHCPLSIAVFVLGAMLAWICDAAWRELNR